MIHFFPSYQTVPRSVNFFILVVSLGINYLSVWFLWRTPLLATLPILSVGIFLLLYAKSWKLFLTYIIFMLCGAGQEAFFISQGFWFYEQESFSSIPAYLPFIWGNIALLVVGMLKGLLLLKDRFKLFHDPPNFRRASITATTAIPIVISGIYFLIDYPSLLILFFLCFDVFYIILFRSIPLTLVGLIALFAGSLADLIAVPNGIWSYPNGGAIFEIPTFIFFGWDIVGLLAAGIYLALDAWDENKDRSKIFFKSGDFL